MLEIGLSGPDVLFRVEWSPSATQRIVLRSAPGGRGELPPPPLIWSDNLMRRTLSDLHQPGLDRVIRLEMSTSSAIPGEDLHLILEMTGRNSNLILVRPADGRIIGCARRVPSSRSRYRSIEPGGEYAPPPPSGAPLEQWDPAIGSLEEMEEEAITATAIARALEGVGTDTARAVLRAAAEEDVPVTEMLRRLERAIRGGDFEAWSTGYGPMPIRLGPGTPIEQPLSCETPPSSSGGEPSTVLPGATRLLRRRCEMLLERERRRASRKLARARRALESMVDGDTYRLWADLLMVSGEAGRKRGLDEVELTGWDDRPVRIPLRSGRTLFENAGRYYRKARNAAKERRRLMDAVTDLESRVQRCVSMLDEIGAMDEAGLGAILAGEEGRQRAGRTGAGVRRRADLEPVMLDGWRCFVGRSAAQNERISFELARRGDLWLHARGIPGPHVLLKRDGRKDNPPESVIAKAAALAVASSGGKGSRIVPVVVTDSRYVRRLRGGKQGEVTYSNERTLFIETGSA